MAEIADSWSDEQRFLSLARTLQEDQWHRHNSSPAICEDTNVFGFPLRITTNRPSLLECSKLALGRFTRGPDRLGERGIQLSLLVREASRDPNVEGPGLLADGRVHFEYDGCGDWAAIDFGEHGHCAIDLANRAAVGFLSDALSRQTELVARFVISTALLNILARCGLIQWHAAAMVKGAKVAMLVGADNMGKSTTALALLRAGYQILGESLTYTRPRGERFELMGFPVGHLRLRGNGMAFFPEWRQAGRLLPSNEGSKWLLDLNEIMPDRVLRDSLVTGDVHMLFVSVGPRQATEVRPISEREALEGSIAACSLWEGERQASSVLRDVRRMVKRVPCHRVLLGKDLDLAVHAIDRVLEGR